MTIDLAKEYNLKKACGKFKFSSYEELVKLIKGVVRFRNQQAIEKNVEDTISIWLAQAQRRTTTVTYMRETAHRRIENHQDVGGENGEEPVDEGCAADHANAASSSTFLTF